MKQIKFDNRFKEAILNKEKVATIRNNKKVDVGEDFIIVDANNIHIAEAECIGVLRFNSERFFIELEERVASFPDVNIALFINENHQPVVGVRNSELGFNNWQEALYSYKTYLKNEHCYLHIFELFED